MYLNTIGTLHFEWTSYCNAKCPQCGRTDNTKLPIDSVSLDQVKQWFTPDMISSLSYMYSCGNYGDPITHPDCIGIVDWFLSNGCKNVSLHSNGGVRNTDFWTKLGERKIRVTFAIDGLEDTNHIYRVGVSWTKLMQNVHAFIQAGGRADWAYLIFSHNEHQIDAAKQLATKLGFNKFVSKASSRFTQYKVKSEIRVSVDELKNRAVANRKNQQVVPALASLKAHDEQYIKVIDQYGDYNTYVTNTEISCKTQKENSIYVDFLGRIWPCCWVGHTFPRNSKTASPTDAVIDKYGKDFNSLHCHALKDIMNHEWFQQDLENSWKTGANRIETCSEMCGKEYSASSLQFLGTEWLKKN